MLTQPVFCTEKLKWNEEHCAGYIVAVSFTGPDDKIYTYTQRTETNECDLLTPYGRKVIVTVGAIYYHQNGDMYTLTSDPFEFEGCASKKRR